MSTLTNAAKGPMQDFQNQELILSCGDGGADEAQMFAVLAANADKVKIIGAACVFGNTSLDNGVKNTGSILRFFDLDEKVPYFAGMEKPYGEEAAFDYAHGEDGIGGIELPEARKPVQEQHAVDFIINAVKQNPGKITITMTGPASNIAAAIRKNPDVMKNVKRIVMMGGCTDTFLKYPAEFKDGEWRRLSETPEPQQGNLTDHAEFNAYNASIDLKTVLEFGIPIKMFPMNCTHQLTCTPEVEAFFAKKLAHAPEIAKTTTRLLTVPRNIDRVKTTGDAVMHDVLTGCYIVAPDEYEGRQGRIEVITDGEMRGKTIFTPDESGHIWVAEKIKNPENLYNMIAHAFSISTLHAAPSMVPSRGHRGSGGPGER